MNTSCNLLTPIHLMDTILPHGGLLGTGGYTLPPPSASPAAHCPPRWDAVEAGEPWSLQAVTNFFHQACFSPMSDNSLGTTPK